MMELASVADIGRLLDVSKQRASQIANEPDKHFPKPLGHVNKTPGNPKGSPIWRMRDVRRWRRSRDLAEKHEREQRAAAEAVATT